MTPTLDELKQAVNSAFPVSTPSKPPRIRRKWYLRIRYTTGEGDNRYLMFNKEYAYQILNNLCEHIRKHDTLVTFRFGTTGEKALVRLTDIHSITVIGEPPTGQIK